MNDKLSTWLAKELENRGWSHRELARRADVSQTAVSQAISEQRIVGWDFCAAIAKALGESPEKVFRLAGLLPPLPSSGDGPTLDEIIDLVKQLPEEEKEDVLEYAKSRYKKSQRKSKPPKITAIAAPKPAPVIEYVPSIPDNIPPEIVAKTRAYVDRLTPNERADLIEFLLSRRDFVEALKLRGVEVQSGPRDKVQQASAHKDQE